MKFKIGEQMMTLQGDRSLCKTLVSLKALMMSLGKEGHGLVLELSAISVERKMDWGVSDGGSSSVARGVKKMGDGSQKCYWVANS